VSDSTEPRKPTYEELERKVERLEKRVDELLKALEQAKRGRKRQASPFSKGEPKAEPKKPGRKSGRDHGPTACRPHPEHIDEEHEALLPRSCPCCGGQIVEKAHEERQYQTDTPMPRPIVRQYTFTGLDETSPTAEPVSAGASGSVREWLGSTKRRLPPSGGHPLRSNGSGGAPR